MLQKEPIDLYQVELKPFHFGRSLEVENLSDDLGMAKNVASGTTPDIAMECRQSFNGRFHETMKHANERDKMAEKN